MTEIPDPVELPGWNELAAAGRVDAPSPDVVARAQAAVHRAVLAADPPAAGRAGTVDAPGAASPQLIPSRRGSPGRTRRQRLRRLGLVAVGAAAVAVAVPVLLPPEAPGRPSAALADATKELAVTAENTPADILRPGQFRHEISREINVMESRTGRTTHTTQFESWTDVNGVTWRRDTDEHGTVSFERFRAGTYGSTADFAKLPRDPRRLVRHLESVVTGSSSRQEAVFVALTDMLRTGLPDPELRATMIRAIGLLPKVTVDTHAVDIEGRRGVALTWTQRWDQGVGTQSLIVDPSNARTLSERATTRYFTKVEVATERSVDMNSVVIESRVVDAVPEEVLRAVAAQR